MLKNMCRKLLTNSNKWDCWAHVATPARRDKHVEGNAPLSTGVNNLLTQRVYYLSFKIKLWYCDYFVLFD